MALDANQGDAFAYLQSLLAQYGLQELNGWAMEQVTAGYSPTVIAQLMYDQPAFKARFPVIEDRRFRGLPPMSVGEILEFENQARALFRSNNLPSGFFDSSEDFRNFMVYDVSISELADRIDQYKNVVYNLDPTAKAALQNLYGISEGSLLAYVIDPDKALPLLETQVRERPAIAQRIAAAQLSSVAQRAGFGALSADEGLRFIGQGVNPAQAGEAFGSLVANKELFGALPGETDGAIDRNTQLSAALGGDEAARQRIRKRAEARVAAFSGGGSFAASQTGVSGLGSANT